jgi:hypothetical protein
MGRPVHYREDAAVCSSHDREHTSCRSLEIASGADLLWLNEAVASLRSNIPQTELVATLDTYDLFRFPICRSVILDHQICTCSIPILIVFLKIQ